jgi:hypothetical protein
MIMHGNFGVFRNLLEYSSSMHCYYSTQAVRLSGIAYNDDKMLASCGHQHIDPNLLDMGDDVIG